MNKGSVILTKEEIYQGYLKWEKKPQKRTQDELFLWPFADYNLFENQAMMISRLYYLVPAFDGDRVHFFVFYEANTYLLDDENEARLVYSTLEIQRTE